jgi:hypothetical protein
LLLPVLTIDHRIETEPHRKSSSDSLFDTGKSLVQRRGFMLTGIDDCLRRQGDRINDAGNWSVPLPEQNVCRFGADLNLQRHGSGIHKTGLFLCKSDPLLRISGNLFQCHQIRIIRDTKVHGMLFQMVPDLSKNILQIDKYDNISGRVHAFQITVFTVINAVHDTGSIIEILVAEVLTHRCAFVDQAALFCSQNQIL